MFVASRGTDLTVRKSSRLIIAGAKELEQLREPSQRLDAPLHWRCHEGSRQLCRTVAHERPQPGQARARRARVLLLLCSKRIIRGNARICTGAGYKMRERSSRGADVF